MSTKIMDVVSKFSYRLRFTATACSYCTVVLYFTVGQFSIGDELAFRKHDIHVSGRHDLFMPQSRYFHHS